MGELDYRIAAMIEAVRYAELERLDLDQSEDGFMIRAIWELIDPLDLVSRESSISTLAKDEDGEYFRFTAHLHNNEPLRESFNDIMVYRSLRADGVKSAHYIIDRFCPKKIV